MVDDTRGLVYAGGAISGFCTDAACSGDDTVNGIAVFDKRTGKWAPLRSTAGVGVSLGVIALLLDDSTLYVGGNFDDAGGVDEADNIAKWTWSPPSGSGSYTASVGSSVSVAGAGFVGVSAVTIGGIAATVDYAASSETSLQVTVPAGVSGTAPIVVTAVGGTATVGTVGPGSGPTPDPGTPPSAPLNVTADAGDASAVVSWQAPASAGSFPVSNYQAVVSPGGQSCLVSAPALSCEISGLTNGTAYTAQVRALNGAGWGAYSVESASFTPERPVVASIVIAGSRGPVNGKSGIIVTGSTTGFGEGAILRPWIRFPGQSAYVEGSANILVDTRGDFTWQRKTGKKAYVSVRSQDGSVVSNRIVIDAR